MIAIPNMEKPKKGEVIAFDGEYAVYTDDDMQVHRYPLIEIVTCGECKWCEEEWDSNNNCPTWECKNWFGGTDYDGYCHEGERRADEEMATR